MKLKNCQLIFSSLIPILLFTSCVTKDRAGLPCLGALEANDPYEAQGIAGVLLNGQENSIIELITGATNDRKGIVQECGGISLGINSSVTTAGQTSSGETSSGSGIVFPNSTYSFTLGVQITRVTPTLSGTITNCRSNPTLPSGIQIDSNTCALFGNPSVASASAQYEILADASSGTVFRTNLTISVGSGSGSAGSQGTDSSSGSSVASGGSNTGGSSNAGSTFAPEQGRWIRLAFGNGVFVATSFLDNFLMTSTDGINWVQRAPFSGTDANKYNSIEHGNGLFVAARGNNPAGSTLVTSPDGVTWTSRTNPNRANWEVDAYENNTFVFGNRSGGASGYDNTRNAMTSTDGISWTAQTAPTVRLFSFGNGNFVRVNGSGVFATSTDGITWNDRGTFSAANQGNGTWNSVVYGNNEFIGVAGSGSNRVIRGSNDGTTWTMVTGTGENSVWMSIAYGNGAYVAIASQGTNRVYRSTNGTTWDPILAPGNSAWQEVVFGNNLFVAVANQGTKRVMTSTDGQTWELR